MIWIDRAIGIDLGTTNSATAMLSLDGQRLLLAEDRHGRTIIPSMVGWDGDRIVTGFDAWNRRGMRPEPIGSIKRKMGLQQTLDVGPQAMTPVQISAEILRAQRDLMASYVTRLDDRQHRVDRAVITVPAYFDAPQIEATRMAGEQAGLEVLGLLQEPTAACMYVVWKRGLGDGNFLVYDLGGGTFDVSIVRCLYGEYQVIGIHGDNYLGGDDFDRRLAEHLRRHLVQKGYALDLDIANNDEDAVRFLILTRLARTIKEALSAQEVYYAAQRDIFEDQVGKRVTLELDVSRSEWNGMMNDLIDSTIRCCHEALERASEKAEIGLSDIDHVLLVGGSTRVPLVAQKVRDNFCGEGHSKAMEPIQEAPDSCVALGAAIQAANLGGILMGDDDADVAVAIDSSLTSPASLGRLVGHVSGDGSDGVETIMLRDTGDATAGLDIVGEQGRFKLTDIPLPDEGTHPMTLELLDATGSTLLAVPLTLHRKTNARQTGSALSNPTVLAKDIYLEVVKDGTLERQILVPRGTTLPTLRNWRFYTGDQSGAVLLTLLQNRYPISTLHLSVPTDLPVGTPVLLELEVDEKMIMTASGDVSGQSFWAQIESPPPRELRDWESIEVLVEEAEQLGGRVWGHEARIYQREAPFLLAGIREAARTDPDKLMVLVGRLEELMEFLRGQPGELTPGFSRFETVLDKIRRIVLREEEVMGMDFDLWQERLDEINAKAEAAWKSREQKQWDRVYTQTQALYETVAQEESRFVKTNSLEHVMSLFRTAQLRLLELEEKLQEIVLPNQPETRRLRKKALDSISADVREHVTEPLNDIKDRLEGTSECRAELEQIVTWAKQLDARLTQLPGLGVVVSHD